MAAFGRVRDVIERVALWLALAGGAVLAAIIVISSLSIAARNLPLLLGLAGLELRPIGVPGDVEIAQLGTAVAVFAFLPYCQLKRANVIVDVVTQGLSERSRAMLDLLANLLFLLIAIVLLRQLALAFLDKLVQGDQSMVLRIPEWAPFGLVLLSLGMLVAAIATTIVEDGQRIASMAPSSPAGR